MNAIQPTVSGNTDSSKDTQAASVSALNSADVPAENSISSAQYHADFSTTRDAFNATGSKNYVVSGSSTNPTATQSNIHPQFERIGSSQPPKLKPDDGSDVGVQPSMSSPTSQNLIAQNRVNGHDVKVRPSSIGAVPTNQSSANTNRTYTTSENVINFSRSDHNANIGGNQQWTEIRRATPYYIDKNNNQQMLQIGEKAPADARHVYYSATETIKVRALEGKELGTLQGKNPAQINAMLSKSRAAQESFYSSGQVPIPDTNKHFTSLNQAREYSRKEGYYGSGPHLAAAQGAEARTGGKIPAKWFMENDPFMGRAGSNAAYFPNRQQGLYPGTTAKIGVAHDADYGLGATFGAGPLSGLSRTKAPKGGLEGLLPNQQESQNNQALSGLAKNGKDYPQYGTGHNDWNVTTQSGKDSVVPAPRRGSLVPG
jgi:hypothetical protein